MEPAAHNEREMTSAILRRSRKHAENNPAEPQWVFQAERARATPTVAFAPRDVGFETESGRGTTVSAM